MSSLLKHPIHRALGAQLCFQTQGIRDQPVKVADPLFLRPKVSKCAIPWSRLRRVGHQTLQPWVPVFGCLAWCLQGVELRFLRCKLLGACQRESLNALASTQPLRNPGASQILHIRRWTLETMVTSKTLWVGSPRTHSAHPNRCHPSTGIGWQFAFPDPHLHLPLLCPVAQTGIVLGSPHHTPRCSHRGYNAHPPTSAWGSYLRVTAPLSCPGSEGVRRGGQPGGSEMARSGSSSSHRRRGKGGEVGRRRAEEREGGASAQPRLQPAGKRAPRRWGLGVSSCPLW